MHAIRRPRPIGRALFVVLAVAICALGCAGTPGVPSISSEPLYDYTVTVDPTTTPPEVRVTLEVTGGPLAEVLALPSGSTFVRLESPLLEGPLLEESGLASGTATLLPTESPFVWRLEAARSATISWRVPHVFREHPPVRAASDEYEFPFIEHDHALLYTPTFLLLPATPANCRVRFRLPSGWSMRTPWGSGGAEFRGSSVQLKDDYVALGNWVERRVEIGQFVGTITFCPAMAPLADRVADQVSEVLIAEFEMFGVEARGSYLVVFGPAPGVQLGGSPKRRSMVLAVDPALVANPPAWFDLEVVHLVAHEFHHTWTNGKPPLPDSLRWYAEGFTDYMAWLLCARLGLFDRDSWHDQVTSLLSEVRALSIRRQISLATAGGKQFFEGGEAYAFVYGGGFLVALEVDLSLRAIAFPGGLEGFMRGFNNDPAIVNRAPTLPEFFAALEAVLGKDPAARFQRRVTRVGGLDLDRRTDLVPDRDSLWDQTVVPAP